MMGNKANSRPEPNCFTHLLQQVICKVVKLVEAQQMHSRCFRFCLLNCGWLMLVKNVTYEQGCPWCKSNGVGLQHSHKAIALYTRP